VLVLLEKSRLSLKTLPGKNVLAYYGAASVTKSFKTFV
jgi:hypothetical protein